MDKFFTYIIYSDKLNKYYIGSTTDLDRRIKEHNRGKTPFARLGMPWQLKYSEEFLTRTEAVRRELEIKRRKDRKYIEKLIGQFGSEHPG